MADNGTQSTGKNFFSTLPGIITAIAGLITATGGLLLTLNKTGCTGKTSEKNVAEQKDTVAINKNELLKDSSSSATVSYSPTVIKHVTRNLSYKIQQADIETLPGKEIVLSLKIKCVNDSKYEYHFYSTYIRVQIGEDKYAPDLYSGSGGYQSIPDNSFKNLEYNFKLPAGVRRFDLVFYDETTQIGSSVFILK